MEITKEVEPYFEFCLELECAALDPYSRFVYDDHDHALAVMRFLGEKGLIESSPGFGRVLLDGDQPIGMISGIPGAELRKLRMRAAFALRKSPLRPNEATQRRIGLANEALLKLEDSDFYLGKLGIDPTVRSHGSGEILVNHINEEARAGRFRRAVAEVAPSNRAAVRLGEKCGYKQLRHRRVEDRETGRSLEYIHIACPCDP